jgi:hypothetical protein
MFWRLSIAAIKIHPFIFGLNHLLSRTQCVVGTLPVYTGSPHSCLLMLLLMELFEMITDMSCP